VVRIVVCGLFVVEERMFDQCCTWGSVNLATSFSTSETPRATRVFSVQLGDTLATTSPQI
jgi:hypothetical protein